MGTRERRPSCRGGQWHKRARRRQRGLGERTGVHRVGGDRSVQAGEDGWGGRGEGPLSALACQRGKQLCSGDSSQQEDPQAPGDAHARKFKSQSVPRGGSLEWLHSWGHSTVGHSTTSVERVHRPNPGTKPAAAWLAPCAFGIGSSVHTVPGYSCAGRSGGTGLSPCQCCFLWRMGSGAQGRLLCCCCINVHYLFPNKMEKERF